MTICDKYNECANKNTTNERPVKEQAAMCYLCGLKLHIAKQNRKDVLLRAAHDLLQKCNEGMYVKSVLEETAEWDDATCDGYCLLDELKLELELD